MIKIDKDLVIRGNVLGDFAEYINTIRFRILIPNHIFAVDDKILSGEIELPWMDTIDPDRLVPAFITINELLPIYTKKIMFKVPDRLDLFKMFKYINRYLLSLQSVDLSNITNNHREYFVELSNLKKCLETMLNILSKKDPGILERVRNEKGRLTGIIEELC